MKINTLSLCCDSLTQTSFVFKADCSNNIKVEALKKTVLRLIIHLSALNTF